MPVSVDRGRRPPRRRWFERARDPALQPAGRDLDRQRRPSPCSVNLKAFESRFFSTCCSRFGSVSIVGGSCRSSVDARSPGPCSSRPRGSRARRSACSSANSTGLASTSIVPDSIFDRSRISLISSSRSEPDEWIVCANSTCFSVRFAFRVLRQQLRQDQQAVERRAQLVRHVREELRLVLRGQRELLGLLFERQSAPARSRGSSARLPCSARPAAPPSLRAPRWSAAALPAAA